MAILFLTAPIAVVLGILYSSTPPDRRAPPRSPADSGGDVLALLILAVCVLPLSRL